MFGALIGDTVGSAYEFHNHKDKMFPLITKYSRPTDDSIMTLAVQSVLYHKKWNDEEYIVNKLKEFGNAYPYAGYGGHFRGWLFGSEEPKPYNSCGNGSAMRVSACGWYGKDENEVIEMAKAVTRVTHNHPEGMKGAIVTALCVYYARIGKSKEFIKEYVSNYYDLNFDYEDLRQNYKFCALCQDTVPQAVYCFLISTDFTDCLRTTISIGGDSDTLAAISCAIAEAYYKEIDSGLLKTVVDKISDSDVYPEIKELINDHLIQFKDAGGKLL